MKYFFSIKINYYANIDFIFNEIFGSDKASFIDDSILGDGGVKYF